MPTAKSQPLKSPTSTVAIITNTYAVIAAALFPPVTIVRFIQSPTITVENINSINIVTGSTVER